MKKMKKVTAAAAALTILLSSVQGFAAGNVWKISRSDIDVDLRTEKNDVGVWSFYESDGFWPRDQKGKTGSGITTDYKYGDVSNEEYYRPMNRMYLIQKNYYGILIRDAETTGTPLQIPSVNITTNRSDQMTKFMVGGIQEAYMKRGDIAVCFTAPNDGYYDIYHYFTNKSLNVNGGGGILRRSIMKNGEVMESAENSVDTKFGTVTNGVSTTAEENVKEYLKAGEKIYFRVSAGIDKYNDDL